MSTKAIFSPVKVGNHLLKHRVVLAPLTRMRATLEGAPTEIQAIYYQQRASEGGLLITEATGISRLSGAFPHVPGIYTQEQIEGWKKVTSAVHEKNGVIYTQIWHTGRAGTRVINPNQEQPVSASPIAITGLNMLGADHEVPRALEIDEIKVIVQEFRQAALNAIEAGFDGVEIHGANGFLIDQFINSNSNQRTDIYGGSIENRARFALEVVDAIVDAIGAERTAIRFSPGANHHDMKDESPEETWGYLVTKIQEKHPNLSYLHFLEARSNPMNDAVVNTADSLEPYRKLWKSVFISSGGFSNAVEHALDLAENTGDLIAFGRTFIANPDLPERLLNGWELNKYDRSTFYSQGEEGYTDYIFYKDLKQ